MTQRSRAHRLVFGASLLAAVFAAEARAAASPAHQCVDADDKGLSLEEAGKLVEARAELASCSAPSCPSDVRAECEKELATVEAAIPTVVFEAKDATGHDLAAVDLAIDGTPHGTLDGTQLELDPGTHEFTFTAAGQRTRTVSFVLHEGEKGRHERVAIGELLPASVSPGAGGAEGVDPRAPLRHQTSPLAIAGYVTGGAGLVALGLGSVFGVMAFAAKNAQESACSSSSCGAANRSQASGDLSDEQRDSAIATGAFVAAGALVATGVVFLIVGARQGNANAAALLVTPSPLPGGGALLLHGEF